MIKKKLINSKMRFRIYQFFKVIFIYCLIIFLVSVLLPLLTSIMYRPDAKSEISICWVLNFSDGLHSLKEISQKSNLPLKLLRKTAKLLIEKKLLKKIN